MDANRYSVASKKVEPNLVPKALEEGVDLGSNEDATLADSKDKVTPEDKEEELEEEKEEVEISSENNDNQE